MVSAPLIHMNGTSADYLLRQLVEASRALRAARLALESTAPNPRDFYPYEDGPSRLLVARKQHEARITALRTVDDELEELEIAIMNQQVDRQKRMG